MMFTESKQWVLVGLTSNGIECGDDLYSGVYTRVAAFENWIRMNMNDSYWISRVIPALSRHSLVDSSSNLINFSFKSMLQNLIPAWKSASPNTPVYSHATNVSTWNYHRFLCTLLLFSFVFFSDL
jgi:hypothetical protein